jgi:hypothetical protein
MNRYQTFCLAMASVCLIAGAATGAAGWLACTRYRGGLACKGLQSDAMAAWSLAANVFLAVPLQTRKPEQ